MHKIIITGAGSGGGENLINSLRACPLELTIYGSNMDEYLLAKSTADRRLWLPPATDESYLPTISAFIARENIELIIPNNDTEIGIISANREHLPCKVFLPPNETVKLCQDKLRMHECFSKKNIPQAIYKGLTSLEGIDDFIHKHPAEKYWVRPRRGSGSIGTTWVQNAGQAKAWINLWCDLRGFKVTDFIVSEFLPGADYAFQSVWKNGQMVVGKMIERLQYVMGQSRLSGMSSSPSIARTLLDMETFNNVIEKAIRSVCERPQGNFNLDLKGRADGSMCVTEFNIGRFCMITPIFDLTGKYNTAEMHLRSAFDLDLEVENPLDFEDNCYLIRELDTKPTILRGHELTELITSCKKAS